MVSVKFWRKPTEADKAKSACLARNGFEPSTVTFSATWDAAQGLWTLTGLPHVLVLVAEVQCTVKLSDAQYRVMDMLGRKWPAHQGSGSAVMVNGKRVCNVDTITSLIRAGLVEEDGQRCWKATEDGRKLFSDREQ